ncbi:hypothetical protein A2W14_04180 [Candidatus Gottesmanbacteria bacterium RBG_16_37_8]|uniref:Metallopeptidase family protein n=1 Tax=Candidatus Gottesmanbacteria bacterium RBG_16_37_8 TaxID=1798371 RepID=A0A1F5YPP7_9BACT|nr:MAG: hypothetical protein A2W14_04180 [Candidatus Gottesmanbacteria bacterium RBG_16_37_8]
MLYTRKEFETIVAESLDSLPEEFGQKIENVSVEVEEWPTREDLKTPGVAPGGSLFGLYWGVPKTNRAFYANALPDKIIIFAGPIISYFGYDRQILKEKIRETVLHEIAHHFGMTDEEIKKARR